MISITSDNGWNMIATFPFLNQKNGCKNIQRLFCIAHTIQLAIEKGLALAEILIAHAYTSPLINYVNLIINYVERSLL